jgi:hypothetical protein
LTLTLTEPNRTEPSVRDSSSIDDQDYFLEDDVLDQRTHWRSILEEHIDSQWYLST